MHIKVKGFIILVLCGLLFVACSGGNSAEDGSEREEVGAGEASETPDTLTVAVPTEMATMDLYNHGDHVTLHAVNNMFNSLFKRSPEGEIEPDLVDSYDNIDDTTWTFTLKEGVTFHTGDKLTAEDVKFTLERAASDESLIEHGTFSVIKGVNVIDDYQFEIVTHEPNPLLLSVLARPGAGIYSQAYIEENGWDHFLENPVGTGPYRFVSWDKGSSITFEAFEDYFSGPAEDWKTLVFRTIPESSTRVGELLTGGVDIIPNVISNEWNRIEADQGTYLASYNSQRVAIIVPRANEGSPTADPRVREAIDLAINNSAIIDALLGGAATPIKTRVAPGNFGANEHLFDTYDYDLDRAKALMEEAGYGDGLELTMHSSNGRYARDKEVAEMISGMLSEIGIKLNLELMEWNSYLELRRANNVGDLHMVWLANSFYDGHILVSEILTSDRSMENLGYNNSELEELLTLSATNMDEQERREQLERAQEIIAEERMRIYVYLEHNTYGVSETVQFNPRLDELIKAYEIKKR